MMFVPWGLAERRGWSKVNPGGATPLSQGERLKDSCAMFFPKEGTTETAFFFFFRSCPPVNELTVVLSEGARCTGDGVGGHDARRAGCRITRTFWGSFTRWMNFQDTEAFSNQCVIGGPLRCQFIDWYGLNWVDVGWSLAFEDNLVLFDWLEKDPN